MIQLYRIERRRLLNKGVALAAAAAVLLGALPSLAAHGTEGDRMKLVGPPINEAYLDYIRDGGQGLAPSAMDLSYLNESYAGLSRRRNALLPASYDLRQKGVVPPVSNQNPYGICWTFSALGSAESGMMEQFPHISFSNIHLAWFSRYGNEEEEFTGAGSGGNDFDPFNDGGNDGNAVGTLAAWKGPVSEELVPYDTTQVDESLRYASAYHLQDAYYMPNGIYHAEGFPEPAAGRDVVKQIMMEKGAISVAYTAGDMATYYNEKTSAWYNDAFAQPDHAVLAVGWDDHYPKENFKEGCRPEKDGAWLIRNSWGTDWGDDGYFWLSYEDNTLQLGSYFAMEAADNYQRNYQYDTLGWCFSVGFADESGGAGATAYAANIFTAEADEQMEAVSFYTTDAGTGYEISVYTDLTDPRDPTSGKRLTGPQSGVEPYAGYHTIELGQAVPLRAGKRFSVVVKLSNPSYDSPIPVEWCPLPPGVK